MRSTELHFPVDCRDLSSDCKDLCQKLLRRNPGKHLCEQNSEDIANIYILFCNTDIANI